MTEESPTIANVCPSDKPVGTAIVILSIFGLLAATYVAVVSWVIFEMFGQMFMGSGRSTGFFPSTPQSSPPNPAILIFALLLAICGVMLASGLGIRKGARGGFGMGIVVFALFLLFGKGAAVFGAGVVLYCVLRLNGKLGSAPV